MPLVKEDRDSWATEMDCWMALAAALVRSGRECGDRRFLDSEWCKELKEGVAEWAQIRLKDGHACSLQAYC